MILASWKAIPKNIKQGGFLKGPAKVYDGAFDEDYVYTSNFITNTETPFSVLLALDAESIASSTVERVFYYLSDPNDINDLNIALAFSGGNFIFQFRGGSSTQSIIISFPASYKKQIICVSYDGSRLASGVRCYIDSLEVMPTSIIRDNLIFNIFSESSIIRIATITNFKGAIKQFEFLNRVASPVETIAATNPVTGGSFRASGIAHNTGDYLLAVDFNKTDGNPPTTFANTPTYTITSFGGAQYVPYQSL